MKRKTLHLSIYLLGFFVIALSCGAATVTDNAGIGRSLHLKILRSHPKIDNFYRKPFIHGGLTNNPTCCISVPEQDWRSLSPSEKQALKDYAASLVQRVKSDPAKYAAIPSDTTASNLKRNVSKMNENSWGIMVGKISQDGRDISSDEIVK
jgi:hypothetical protein